MDDPRQTPRALRRLTAEQQERAVAMAEAWAAGTPLRVIGEEHGLTGQRVSQIIDHAGYSRWAREQRKLLPPRKQRSDG